MSTVTSESEQNVWLRDPDVQRMLRVQNGDEAAFGELVEAYQNRLIGIFNHLLRDAAAAEDLTQEAFLRVYRARERYRPTAKFSTWLFRIANNLAMNNRRSKSRRKEVHLKASESGPLGMNPQEQLALEKSGLMPGRQLDRKEMREVVRQALDTLSDRQKMALLLNKFEHMSYQDIAASMDLSVPAVKSLLTRARENLKTKLEPFL
ncbi:MAG: sigma-70 family RNA polymerase sigma factor [Planctomycetota bacterium]|nr:sigma-70 family RNA polymerase sigma factor [Planctomycetota bacterium]MDA1248861.1 sigma-70 family RNA polymerase sigma factor [Planctomycetota bacterium]